MKYLSYKGILLFAQDIIQEAGEQLEGFMVICMYANHMCDLDQFTRFFDPYYYNCFTYKAPKLATGDFGNEKGEVLVEGTSMGFHYKTYSLKQLIRL